MNAYPNFQTEIDGQTIHFVHARSAEPGARALVLTDTYPGSFAEFLDLIDPLIDRSPTVAVPRTPSTS